MDGKEASPLLKGEKEGYGGQVTKNGDSSTADQEACMEASNRAAEEAKNKRAAGKRERMKRRNSLEKVDEDVEKKGGFPSKRPSKGFGCQNLSNMFGVKSYLHHFYETHSYKDPDMYEEEEDQFRYLLHPPRRRRRCTSIWWKVFVWIGANFLVFGVVGVLVGYLVPQKQIIVASIADNIEVIDRQAIPFNFNLDVCKLVGLILFCIGGLTLTVALLFPSFLYHYCEDDRSRDAAFRVKLGTEEKPPLSPLDRNIPASSMLTNVQPGRKADESIVTQEGMVAYKD